MLSELLSNFNFLDSEINLEVIKIEVKKVKKYFVDFVKENFPQRQGEIVERFEKYLSLLREQNKKVNLVSRETKKREFWTLHFLDSILPVTDMNLQQKKVLDFGTGGGMPGIPLKLIEPKMKLYLLDAKQKKMLAVQQIIKKLDLQDCFTIVSRLEDLGKDYDEFFDYIVCRSVRIKPVFAKNLLRILAKDGEIYLYKGRKIDDGFQFGNHKLIDVSRPEIGVRNIIKIRR
ncbi:MAG TPA: 16S rRNA (guanine(527)-N(7))-methyltransferase RsmG [Candidatus Cloacimonas sp.]|nr:rRNA (guanine527-N7)-methyltransferase [Candidatus Cloacimonadota bacterium]HCX72499.1 16S rRNA (guanine(527)-N(7))-methyltransferase RsmG [Candidatus Cloacimonas sp.]